MHEATIGQRDSRVEGTKTPGRSLTLGRVFLSTVAGLWVVLTSLAAASMIYAAAGLGKTDFFTFLDSSRHWQQGLSPYEPRRWVDETGAVELIHRNLNHPITIPLLAPLTGLGPTYAFFLWDLLGLLAFLAALVLAMRALPLRLTRATLVPASAILITCPGVIYGLQLGQWGLLLALPVVGLWLLLREAASSDDRRGIIIAGLLFGLLLALKPFLLPLIALFLPRRRWPGLFAAGVGGAGLSALALPFVGLRGYRQWLEALGSIDWYDTSTNIALNGLLHRVVPQDLPGLLGWALQGIAVVLGIIVIWRKGDETPAAIDRAVGVLLLLAMLGSPLGWLYYTPLLIPALLPAIASWPTLTAPRRRFLVVAALLFWMPHFLLPLLPETLWAELTLRAAPTYGLLVLLAYLLTTGANGDQSDADERLAPPAKRAAAIGPTLGG